MGLERKGLIEVITNGGRSRTWVWVRGLGPVQPASCLPFSSLPSTAAVPRGGLCPDSLLHSHCAHLSCWVPVLGRLQAAFNYEPINMGCAVPQQSRPHAPLPAFAPRKIGFCVVHFSSPVHVGWEGTGRGQWIISSFPHSPGTALR